MTPRGNNLITQVHDLINPVDGMWDEELINDMFWSVDAHRILQIPLTFGREDFVAWHYTRLGVFTVRSAYYCEWNYKFGRHERNVDIVEGAKTKVWQRLWKLEVPSKKNWMACVAWYDTLSGILANIDIR